jgi:hypothetical protein
LWGNSSALPKGCCRDDVDKALDKSEFAVAINLCNE